MKSVSSKEIDVILGKVIKAHRKAAGLSQAELGHAAAVSFQQIQKYESGQNRISVSRLFRIAATLGLEPASIVTEVQSEAQVPTSPPLLSVAATGR